MKKPWLALIIAAIFPGLGHFYIGKPDRGLLIVTAFWVLFTVAVATGIFDRLNLGGGTFYELAYLRRFLSAWIVSGFIYLWQIFDAYKFAKSSQNQ